MAQFPISQTTTDHGTNNPDLLAWSKDDIENRFGFKGGRYTSVNHVFAFLIGALLTGILYALMIFVFSHLPVVSKVATTFQQKREMAFLDECNDYCHSHIVSKLRLVDRQPPTPSAQIPAPAKS